MALLVSCQVSVLKGVADFLEPSARVGGACDRAQAPDQAEPTAVAKRTSRPARHIGPAGDARPASEVRPARYELAAPTPCTGSG